MVDQIFPDSILVGPNDENDGTIFLNGTHGSNSSRVTIGGFGRRGQLQLRDRNGVGTLFVSPIQSDVRLLLGGLGNRSGRLWVYNNNNTRTVELQGLTGSIWLGVPEDSEDNIPGQGGNLILYSGSSLDSGESILITLAGQTGQITCVDLNETSDLRYKENITPLSNPLDKVLAMRGVSYQQKQQKASKKVSSKKSKIGFIGQEVEAVLPEIVSTNSEGYKSVSYTRLTAVLVEAMKEQQKLIKQQALALEKALAKIAQLEMRM